MAELHIIGHIMGGTGFESQNLLCKVSYSSQFSFSTVSDFLHRLDAAAVGSGSGKDLGAAGGVRSRADAAGLRP